MPITAAEALVAEVLGFTGVTIFNHKNLFTLIVNDGWATAVRTLAWAFFYFHCVFIVWPH